MTASLPPVRIGLVDMNAGVKNEAMRCLRATIATFEGQLRAVWRDAVLEVVTVSPRDKLEKVPRDCDLYLSSGGPGSPFEAEGTEWMRDYGAFLDGIVEAHERSPALKAPSRFPPSCAVCPTCASILAPSNGASTLAFAA